MLYDRPYMKNRLQGRVQSFTDLIILTLIFCFVLQSILKLLGGESVLFNFVGLSGLNLTNGYVWTFFSYSLLHEGIIHLLWNLLLIHFVSRKVEQYTSKSEFIILLAASVTSGSMFWILFNYNVGTLIGSSAFAMGSLTHFCLKRPNEPMTFLLFFILPVTIKPKYLLLIFVSLEFYFFIFNELAGNSQIAHSAHLGGAFAGLLLSSKNFASINIPKFSFKFSKSPKRANKEKKATYNYTLNKTSTNYESEIDKILDKINEKGFGSLNQEEKELLEKAKNLFKTNPK